MIRKALFGALILTMVALTGCIDESTIISVNKDGSGTVVSTLYLTKALQEMIEEMAEGTGDKPQGKPQNPFLENEKSYREKASKMGEGVTFVAAKEVRKADGTAGVQVTYAFKDINKLKVDSEPDSLSLVSDSAGQSAGGEPQKKETPITFEFVKGSTPRLTVLMAKKEKQREVGKAEEVAAPDEVPPEEEMAMVKEMFGGFHVQLLVKVDGEITRSNATYVEKDEKTGRKQQVTLIDMELGKLFKDEATFKKLMAMGEVEDMAAAREKLKDIPGLKFETSDKVEIEFN